ncbi:MAG: WYL domain-containing protein [Sedimentisphaerales bacterium]|nr:WYL domain-containing protein [Sedimentisphaerales bacterium]
MKVTRLERILRLLNLLQSSRYYRPAELAELLGISRRTVFRDLEMLYQAGIPCYYDDEQGGYRIDRQFFLPPVNLKLAEAISLLLVSRQARRTDGLPLHEAAQEAARKIECILPAHIQEHCRQVLCHVTTRLAATARHEELEGIQALLQTAIRQHRKCDLSYISFHERKLIRTRLSPYHLHFCQRAWYVIGHSSLHDEIRTFKLGRIKACEMLSSRYVVDGRFRIEDYLGDAWSIIPEGRIYQVRVRFDPQVAVNVAEVLWHRKQKITWYEDGSLLYEVSVDGLGEITWWILGYGDHAEVLEPKALRQQIGRIARTMAGKYTEDGPGPRRDKDRRSGKA